MKTNGTTVSLGDVAKITSSLVDPREMPYRDMVHVGGANIESHTGKLIDLKTAAAEELQSGKYVFDDSMVLYSKIRPYLVKVTLPRFSGLCSADIYPLSADGSRLDTEYLLFLLQSHGFTDYAIRGSNRAGMPKVNRDHLFAYKFKLPDLAEQRRIVAHIKECLDRAEEIENLRHETRSEAEALLPSMLNDHFVELAGEYETVEIGEVSEETRYGTSHKCTSTAEGVAILRIPNVAGGFVNFGNLKYCRLENDEFQRLQLRLGDLLFVRTNGSRDLVGRCAIFEGDGKDAHYAFASYLIRVRLDQSKMLSHYLAFFLNSTHGRAEIDHRRRTSAGQFNINSENLRNIGIPLPPLDVQDQVVRALSTQQESAVALQNELAEAQTEASHLREAILRKAFAGEF